MRQARLLWWGLLVAVLAAIAYGGRFTSGKTDRNELYHYQLAVGGAIEYAFILLAVLAIAGWRTDLLAMRRPASWPSALGLALVVLVGVYVAVAVLDPFLHGGREQGLTPTGWQPKHATAYLVNALVVAGVAPVVEELTYRGLGVSLLERYGRWVAIVAVGCCFALDHGLVQAFPELALFGGALAWLRLRTTSVYPGMLVHATFNGISLVLAVTT